MQLSNYHHGDFPSLLGDFLRGLQAVQVGSQSFWLSQLIAVLYSAPPYSCWTLVIPAESSGIQWSPVEWDRIPVDSTGLQTEIEIELESGSKYMCINNCKHKYGI